MNVIKAGNCNCTPVDNPPAPQLKVVTFSGRCVHNGNGVVHTPGEFWGPDYKNTNVAGFIGSILSMWAESFESQHVSEFTFTYELDSVNTHTAILKLPGDGMPRLLWNKCPGDDGFHSYVTVLEWATHYAAELGSDASQVN